MNANTRSFFCASGLFSAALTLPGCADTPAPAAPPKADAATRTDTPTRTDAENGRFTMTPVASGFLRLDTRTGQTSLCTVSADQAQCRSGADERAALEAEIARLSQENAALKASNPGAPQDEEERRFNRGLDRAETFMRRMLRLFREAEKPASPAL
jgi:hypothetical protein